MIYAKEMKLIPVSIRDATEFVRQYHRHHQPPRGAIFAVAVGDTEINGVAMVGRPVARMLQDGWTAEVIRVATDGSDNACSMLYAACWRACRAMGYHKLITYTLNTEPGTSLRAAGWKMIGETGGGSWSSPSRPRVDRHPLQLKIKWEAV